MTFKVGDIIITKTSPRTLGIVLDIIKIQYNNKTIYKIFFEDSDIPEWCYKKEEYSLATNKKHIQYMNLVYNEWRSLNNVSDN